MEQERIVDVHDTLQVIYFNTQDAHKISLLLNRSENVILIQEEFDGEKSNISISTKDFLFFVDKMQKQGGYTVA